MRSGFLGWGCSSEIGRLDWPRSLIWSVLESEISSWASAWRSPPDPPPTPVSAPPTMTTKSAATSSITQPLDVPSAGCIFQNPDPARDRVPDGIPWSAGALIDRAGLKGHRIGGALISDTHANFFVNDGGATASDIRALIETARRAVVDQFGVELRNEIVMIGEF